MCEAFIRNDSEYKDLPLPKWVKFFREVPGDSQGEILMQVELIPTYGKRIHSSIQSIEPPTRKAFIELILIGRFVTTCLV